MRSVRRCRPFCKDKSCILAGPEQTLPRKGLTWEESSCFSWLAALGVGDALRLVEAIVGVSDGGPAGPPPPPSGRPCRISVRRRPSGLIKPDGLPSLLYRYDVRVPAGSRTTGRLYLAIGVNLLGKMELLGLWLSETEGAKFRSSGSVA